MRVEILNWDKHNPKRDQKTYTWLRLQNDIATDKDLYGLSPAQKWVWICLLCEASKNNSGTLEFDLDWLVDLTKVKKADIEHLLFFLQEKPIITVSLPRADADVSAPQSLTTPTNVRTNDTNVRTNEILPDSLREPRRAFDFEALYKKYPRKEGKQKGIAACKAQIQSPEDFSALSAAIDRYRGKLEREGTDPKYIKQFSSFMTTWRDWLEPDAGTSPQRKSLAQQWLEDGGGVA